jgi:hypothetical protein
VTDPVRRVRYCSPFAASAWLPLWQAKSYLERDGKRWSKLEELDMVSAHQRSAGPPSIRTT